MSGEIKDECGVFAYYSQDRSSVAPQIKKGLLALQDRGDQNAGILTVYHNEFYKVRGPGKVENVFSGVDDIDLTKVLPGNMGIGHVRWSTQPGGNAQPVFSEGDKIALAHNGNVHDTSKLSQFLVEQGINITGTNDSERLQKAINFWVVSGASLPESLFRSYNLIRTRGASSIVVASQSQIVAFRDTPGIRPLVIGESDDGFVFSSETHAFDETDIKFKREVKPGEMVIADKHGLRSIQLDMPQEERMDVFEIVYFAHNKSLVKGTPIEEYRRNMGRVLAISDDVDVDLVIGVPNSGLSGGRGYAQQSGIEFSRDALLKIKDIRSFTQDTQEQRETVADEKYQARADIIKGKRLLVVDDSIVRGVTTPRVVNLLKRAGAKEIHFRVCAPPIEHPDYFGNAFSTREELIAAHYNVDQIREIIGVDSLKYNSLANLKFSLGQAADTFTYHYFDGNYPHPVAKTTDQKLVTV